MLINGFIKNHCCPTKLFYVINNLLIYIKLDINFNKEAYP